jgi:DNA-binding NarL/FixJ family response regulator
VINVALVADSGPAMEAMTRSVATLARVDIVRHCNGRAPITPALKRCAPDLVLVDEMGWPRLAMQRIEEIRSTFPHAQIIVRAERPEAAWLADALRAGASAVVPGTAGPETLGRVLAEVVRERTLDGHEQPAALAA